MNNFRRRLQKKSAPTVVSSSYIFTYFKVTSFGITSITVPGTGTFGTYHDSGDIICSIAFDLNWYKRTIMSDGTVIRGDTVYDHGSASSVTMGAIMDTTNNDKVCVSVATQNRNRPTEHYMGAWYFFKPHGDYNVKYLYHDNTSSPVGTSVTQNVTFGIRGDSSTGEILTDSSYVLFSVTITKTGNNTYSYTINQ